MNRTTLVVLSAMLVVLWSLPTAVNAQIDNFLCYVAQPPQGSPPFQPRTVTLADQIGEANASVRRPVSLCNPADKDGKGIRDPVTHLKGYEIRLKGHVPQVSLRVQNVFGTLSLNTDSGGPTRLLVPTAKCIDQPGASCPDPVLPPDPDAHDVDHYSCYKVRVRARFPQGLQANVVDQFNQLKRFDVKRPTRLCNPVDKNGEGIKDASQHLMCYQVLATDLPGHIGHRVHLNNQFGPEVLDTVGEEELCVPSEKELLPQ